MNRPIIKEIIDKDGNLIFKTIGKEKVPKEEYDLAIQLIKASRLFVKRTASLSKLTRVFNI